MSMFTSMLCSVLRARNLLKYSVLTGFLFSYSISTNAELTPMKNHELSEVVGQSLIVMNKYFDNQAQLTVSEFIAKAKGEVALYAETVKLGTYFRPDDVKDDPWGCTNALGKGCYTNSDINVKHFSLGYLNAQNEWEGAYFEDPFFRVLHDGDGPNRKVIGFGMGFKQLGRFDKVATMGSQIKNLTGHIEVEGLPYTVIGVRTQGWKVAPVPPVVAGLITAALNGVGIPIIIPPGIVPVPLLNTAQTFDFDGDHFEIMFSLQNFKLDQFEIQKGWGMYIDDAFAGMGIKNGKLTLDPSYLSLPKTAF